MPKRAPTPHLACVVPLTHTPESCSVSQPFQASTEIQTEWKDMLFLTSN